jgi:hypothetical protein
MTFIYDMASLTKEGTTRDVRSEEARKMLKEMEFLDEEMDIGKVNLEEQTLYAWKRATMELKEIWRKKMKEAS